MPSGRHDPSSSLAATWPLMSTSAWRLREPNTLCRLRIALWWTRTCSSPHMVINLANLPFERGENTPWVRLKS